MVERYLSGERATGRIVGPIRPHGVPNLHINRFGVILKGRTPGKWRLVTEVSFPEGASVNDGIYPVLRSLQYTSVDRVARAARQLGAHPP